MSIPRQIFNAIDKTQAEIFLYGYIGRFWDIDANAIIKQLESLKTEGLKKVTFYVNSDGGEIPNGMTLFNYLNRNTYEVTWIVDGVAASMGALIIMCPGTKVKLAKYAKLMLHRVGGVVSGDADEVRNYATMMEDWEKSLIDVIATRTGLPAEKVKSQWFDGKDHWINANDALRLKLADEIIPGQKGITPPANELQTSTEMFNFFNTQLLNLNNSQSMKLTNEFAAVLKLTDATEETILAAVRKAIQDKTAAEAKLTEKDQQINDLKAKLDQADKDRVKNLVDAAISAKKIGEDQRETYTNLATGNFDATKKALDAMKGVIKVVDNLDSNQGEDPAKKDWTFEDYQRKDGKALQAMKEKNPAKFSALYEKQYGKKPVL
jgi:ATP-dependent Clp endopeptidase proteolytic subunit ClpP